MDLTFTESETAFRDELRAWLAGQRPRARARATRTPATRWRRDWQRRLYDGGWAAVHWPREYGGRGATLTESAIFFEELGRAARAAAGQRARPPARRPDADGLGHRRAEGALPAADPLRRGDLVPGLQRARGRLGPRGAEDARGARTATTGSSPARRSGPPARSTRSGACSSRAPTSTRPKHKGLTYFLMDMEQDGVQVRPLRQITGEAEFNELFIEEARIPDENVLGGVGNGWKVALTTLMNERAGPRVLPPGPPAPAARRADRGGGRARAARRPGGRRQARRPARQGRDPAPDRLPRPDRRSRSTASPAPRAR